MIAFLVGTIENKFDNTVTMDVNCVGYELTVSNNTLLTLPREGETCKVHTYLQISENTGACLYGFATVEEKDVFLKLITVSGIGPKSAIGVLSGMRLSDLLVAIVKGDSDTLSKIKGLGKKSAERICLELKDKLSGTALLDDGNFADTEINSTALDDAVATLISLGVGKNEAFRLARSKATKEATAEEIILKVLRELGK